MPRGTPKVSLGPMDQLVDLLFQLSPDELRASVAVVKSFVRNRPLLKAIPDERQQSLEGVKEAANG